MSTHSLPLLITVTGPSGTGKDAIIKKLVKMEPNLKRFVTSTTRQPRPDEVHGVNYYFLTREDFLAKLEEGAFAEHNANYHGNLYGTLKSEVEHNFDIGNHVISDINIDGVRAFREHYASQHFAIAILPPSRERLEMRLTQRNPELAEEGRKRLAAMEGDFENMHNPDYVFTNPDMRGSTLRDYDAYFINDDLEVTTFTIIKHLREEIAAREQVLEAAKTA